MPTLLGAAPRRPIAMVLGMHRSGTSLCSHVLSALGLDMTDRVAGPGSESPGQDNPLGHWERWEIVEFHDRILRFFNREFFGQYHDFALPVAWWADPRVAEVRREITAFLERRMGNAYFGFKDPRTVRLMPMWYQIVNELKLAPKIVFCLRNPAQVARSLHVRDGFSLDTGEYRWFSYTVDFFRYTKSAEICTIEYESWFEDPALNLSKLRDFLDLAKDQPEFDLDQVISDLVHHELRHDDPRLSEARQPLIRAVYHLARQAEHDPAARAQLQTIAAQFVTFQQLQGAFERDFERQAAAAARLAALEEEAAARLPGLRGALGEAERRAEEREIAAAGLQGEVAGLRETLAQSGRRIAEHESAVAALNAEIVALRAALVDAERRAQEAEVIPETRAELAQLSDALARAEQEVWERTGLIETMRAELLSLNEALAQPRREAQERLAELAWLESELTGLREAMAETELDAQRREGAATALREEIATLREAIKRAGQQAEARAAEVVRFEREIAGLQETVARAQRDADQSAAAANSLKGELAAAESGLTAARQVGRAAINALAMDKSTGLECLPRLGWRQAMRRWFGLAASA